MNKVFMKKYAVFALSFVVSFLSFSIEATLNVKESLDFVWFSKTPNHFLPGDLQRGQKVILASITKIEERLNAHTHTEMEIAYDQCDYKFFRYSNYMIWGLVKYFAVLPREHELYQNHVLKLQYTLFDQVDYFNRFSDNLLAKQKPKYKTGIARGCVPRSAVTGNRN